MSRTGALLAIAISLGATHARAATNQFRGVNWADSRDNFQSGVVYVSGLSSADTYSSAMATGTSVMSQFVSKVGANAVRLPINEATVSGYWGTYTGAIDAVLSKGSVVLCYWDSGRTNKPPDMNAFWNMWKTVVSKYGGNENAYFEIFNEPNMYSTKDLVSLYSSWLTQFPAIPKSRVILDGTGDAQNVPNIGSVTALDGCLLAVHDYSFFGSDAWTNQSQWVSHFKGEVGNYADRTVCTEWGGPMSPGSKNGVNYGSLDYNQSSNFFQAYIRGMSSQLRASNMGSFYWAGLKDGDWYSMTTRSGTGSNVALSVPNQSGLAQLQNAWTSVASGGAASGGAASGGAASGGSPSGGAASGGSPSGGQTGNAGGTTSAGAGGSGGAELGGVGGGEFAGASSGGHGGSMMSAGGASGGAGETSGAPGGIAGSAVAGAASPTDADTGSNNGCSCATAGSKHDYASGLTLLLVAASVAAGRRKRSRA